MSASEKDLPVLAVQILTNDVQVPILCLSYFITTVFDHCSYFKIFSFSIDILKVHM